MKIFGSTRYVKTDVSESKLIGNYPDVKPYEKYLQLSVKNMWDCNPDNFYLVFNNDFSYYITLCAKEDNSKYSFHKYLKEEDITEEYKELINSYLKL